MNVCFAMVSGSHHLGFLTEPRHDPGTKLAGVGLTMCCLSRKGWYERACEGVGGMEVRLASRCSW